MNNSIFKIVHALDNTIGIIGLKFVTALKTNKLPKELLREISNNKIALSKDDRKILANYYHFLRLEKIDKSAKTIVKIATTSPGPGIQDVLSLTNQTMTDSNFQNKGLKYIWKNSFHSKSDLHHYENINPQVKKITDNYFSQSLFRI